MSQGDESQTVVHGSCVALNAQGILLIGASGSGKSATAIDLVSRGATLVADDQVILTKTGDDLIATCPEGFEGKIEARGIGILNLPATRDVKLRCVVDLDHTELQRLPPRRKHDVLGVSLDLIHGRDNWHLSAGLIALLNGTRAH